MYVKYSQFRVIMLIASYRCRNQFLKKIEANGFKIGKARFDAKVIASIAVSRA